MITYQMYKLSQIFIFRTIITIYNFKLAFYVTLQTIKIYLIYILFVNIFFIFNYNNT